MSKLNKNKSHPLSKYHPLRYALIRESYIAEVMNILYRECSEGAFFFFALPVQKQKEIDSYFYKLILTHLKLSTSNEFYPAYLRKMYQMCEAYSILGNQASAELLSEYFDSYHNDDLIIFEQYISFRYYGSNIFDFPSYLLEIFAQTNVDEVLLRDISLPFSTIYVHFGKQENVKVRGNINYITERHKSQLPFTASQSDIDFLLDGAYITQYPGNNLKITFTTVKSRLSKPTNNCIDAYEEIVSMVLEAASTDTTINEAVELIRKILLNDKTYQTSELLIDTIIEQIIDYLKLAINCVLYLQSYPDDINQEYPETAPANLVSQTKRNSAVKAVAEKKLNQLGYRKIKFCSSNRLKEKLFPIIDDSEAAPNDTFEGDKRTVQAHRRRAHLRKQRYGKGFESWRYVWIKESTIHRDKYQNLPQQYRIYQVND